MEIRFLRLAASLAIASALTGCGQDAPTEVTTVQLAVVAGAEHGGAPFSTPMTQEVTTVPAWLGDPDGSGVALITINLGQREICWEMSVSDITLPATASHIHEAAVGVRGSIVVGLTAPDATGLVTGCTAGLSRELLAEILNSPADFYVNVHTSDFPAGAIRGQLER
jgi:hypothetical protein